MEVTAQPQKQCRKCFETKPLSEFYKLDRMADGHFNKCKTCYCADVRANREAKIGYYREYDRRRFQEDPERRAYTLQLARERAKDPERDRLRTAQYRGKHGRVWAAHLAVGYAVRSGKLVSQACEVCGAKKTHGHHDDYTKPLEVRWLCGQHHREWHRLNGPGKNRD
jgi:hypothetical protein